MQHHDFLQPRNSQRGCFCQEPELGDLLRDPMTLALMAADHVSYRDLDVLLAGARRNLRGALRN